MAIRTSTFMLALLVAGCTHPEAAPTNAGGCAAGEAGTLSLSCLGATPDRIRRGGASSFEINGSDGATGPDGSRGATGPAGSNGSTGPAGSDGPTGPAGSDGSTGPAGSSGATGPAGSSGATGPAGSSGMQGPTGADARTALIRLDPELAGIHCPAGGSAVQSSPASTRT
jgi:hypothetical protein